MSSDRLPILATTRRCMCSFHWRLIALENSRRDANCLPFFTGIPLSFLLLRTPTGANSRRSQSTMSTLVSWSVCGPPGMPTCKTMSSQLVSCPSACMRSSTSAAPSPISSWTKYLTSTNIRSNRYVLNLKFYPLVVIPFSLIVCCNNSSIARVKSRHLRSNGIVLN